MKIILAFAIAFTFFACSGDNPTGGDNEPGVSSSESEKPSSSGTETDNSSSSVKVQNSSSSVSSSSVSASSSSVSTSSSSSDGSSSSVESSSSSDDGGIQYGTLVDTRDNRTYKTVEIGTQTWMAENLNYNASDSKCGATDGTTVNSGGLCSKYGRLYNWVTAMAYSASSSEIPSGVKGICPDGWHLPSHAEWELLEEAVGGNSVAGMKLKSKSGWNNDGNGTDDFGFSALTSGAASYDFFDLLFYGNGYYGNWWSTTEWSTAEGTSTVAYRQYLHYNSNEALGDYLGKSLFFSVRCVKD